MKALNQIYRPVITWLADACKLGDEDHLSSMQFSGQFVGEEQPVQENDEHAAPLVTLPQGQEVS